VTKLPQFSALLVAEVPWLWLMRARRYERCRVAGVVSRGRGAIASRRWPDRSCRWAAPEPGEGKRWSVRPRTPHRRP